MVCDLRSDDEIEWAIYPPIRFSSSSIDLDRANYAPPLTRSPDGRMHFLGTDQIGRDVAAGLIYGCRLSFLTAILAALLTLIIGGLLGSAGGYYGNSGIKIRRVNIIPILFLIIILAYHVTYINTALGVHVVLLVLESLLLIYITRREQLSGPELNLPIDSMVMRLLELMASLPGLLVLLAVSAIIESKSAFATALVIGVIRWTRMAQVCRNESLRLRSKSFIQSAQALGIGNRRILLRHILPNMWDQILVVLVFSTAGFILLESALSFLGIGVALESQTWGSILSEARRHISAWWLAVFPGLAIFLSVLAINSIGESRKSTFSSSSS